MKAARRLSRRPERTGRRLFLAEGPNAVEAALAVPGVVVEVFATPEARERYADLAAAYPDSPAWTPVTDRAAQALSSAVTPSGVVAVCRFVDRDPHTVLTGAGLAVLCADVRDPGNAGTILRTADAAGAEAVLLAGDAVDAYNPKTVRATAGSLFTVPWGAGTGTHEAVAAARAAGLAVLAADGAGEVDLFEADGLLAGPTAWLFGNESHGLPDELADRADHRVRIPLAGGAESLNLATAAAVCLFASARARRGGAATQM